jgi:hypothetical protein
VVRTYDTDAEGREIVPQQSSGGPPAWVTKRDGRVEPFDADKICQGLFAAGEAMGAPNAFLARELTDAVVHFLAADAGDAPVSTAQLAERIAKVVRELGQPALAQAFALRSPAPPAAATRAPAPIVTLDLAEAPEVLARRCLRAYSERAVFSRDLIAAQADGLIRLAGLEAPRALASAVLDTPRDRWGELPARCNAAGQGLVLDGPEWHADLHANDRDWLLRLPALVGRHLIVNLNAAQPPAWARQRGGGPLFADSAALDEPALDAWIEAMRPVPNVRWDWHLQGRDFTAGPAHDLLRAVARRALAGANVSFVFDRPRRPISLGEGLDRDRPAVLQEVGLDLAVFLRLPAVGANADAFTDKLPSLARMAVSAGAQKRKYLRRHTDFGGFLLDRARLAVVPLGLPAVVHAVGGTQGMRQLVERLDEHLQAAGRAASLDVCLDSPGPGLTELVAPLERLTAGLTGTDTSLAAAEQLRAAGALHAHARHGTARVLWPHDREPTADEVVELLQVGWRRTEVVRVLFQRYPAAHGQPDLDL